MAGALIDLLTRQMDDAWHTLQGALEGLTEEEFWWLPSPDAWTLREMNGRWTSDYDQPEPRPPGPLTVAWMVNHLASCKRMYLEYAFGAARLTWDELEIPSTMRAALDELEASHPPLRAILETLSDHDLIVPRRTNWGEWWQTEKIIWTLVRHDVYHGAQIQTTRKMFRSQHKKIVF